MKKLLILLAAFLVAAPVLGSWKSKDSVGGAERMLVADYMQTAALVHNQCLTFLGNDITQSPCSAGNETRLGVTNQAVLTSVYVNLTSAPGLASGCEVVVVTSAGDATTTPRIVISDVDHGAGFVTLSANDSGARARVTSGGVVPAGGFFQIRLVNSAPGTCAATTGDIWTILYGR